MLHHFLYVSDLAEEYPCDFQKIIANAAMTNSACDVTGALWSDGRHFVQLLEGQKAALELVFHDKIASARSHTNIRMLSSGDWEQRLFPDWSMAYLGSGSDTRQIAESLIGRKKFSIRDCSANELINLLTILEKFRQDSAGIAI